MAVQDKLLCGRRMCLIRMSGRPFGEYRGNRILLGTEEQRLLGTSLPCLKGIFQKGVWMFLICLPQHSNAANREWLDQKAGDADSSLRLLNVSSIYFLLLIESNVSFQNHDVRFPSASASSGHCRSSSIWFTYSFGLKGFMLGATTHFSRLLEVYSLMTPPPPPQWLH